MSQGYYAALPERGLVRVSGPDARAFLQRLITAGMDKAGPSSLLFGALLSPQGKYLFDFFIAQTAEESFDLDIAAAQIPAFCAKLKLYRLKAQVMIDEPARPPCVLAIWGAPPPLDGARPDPRLPALGWRAPLEAPDAFTFASALDAAGFHKAGAQDYDSHRIRLGVPDGVRDLQADGDFPLEGLFDELNGVDFKKGCFIGQETASRMKRRSVTRSKIIALDAPGPAIAPLTDVMAGDLRIGDTRSSIPGRALALVRLDRLAAASGPITVDGRIATPDIAPWIIQPPRNKDEA